MDFILRPYQQEAVDSALSSLCEYKDPLIVAPTGAGKSLIIAALIKEVSTHWPEANILLLQHRKELIQQNAHKVMHYCGPKVSFGVYSAGLRSRQVRKVTIAGIQSIYNKADRLPPTHIVLIDEAHLIPRSGEGMYRRLFADLRSMVPGFRTIGLTATPFRTGTGMLHEGEDKLFDEIAYEIPIQRLIAEGYLVPVTTKYPAEQVDLTGVNIRAGEFVSDALEAAMIKVTERAVKQLLAITQNRKSVLIFAAGVEHAKLIQAYIPGSEIVTEETPAMFREKTLKDFREGRVKYLVNRDVLTTGFDSPSCDTIVLLRATASPGLYIQMIGRGMRIAPGKSECVVLDFGRNVERFGPIDSVVVRTAKNGKTEALAPPFKICPDCMTVVAPRVKVCPDCGHEYPASTVNILATPGTGIVLNKPEIVDVDEISYHIHRKAGSPESLRVDYRCGFENYSEWVCVAHPGFAKRKAQQWWKARTGEPMPDTALGALHLSDGLKRPKKITVFKEGKYWRIMKVNEWMT